MYIYTYVYIYTYIHIRMCGWTIDEENSWEENRRTMKEQHTGL